MLLTSDGSRVGSISGGCLENDVATKSWWWTGGGKAVVRVYDTTSDDEAVWEFGLGCNGVVRVLLERLDTVGSKALMAFLNLCRVERKYGVVATVIGSPSPDAAQIGDRWFLEPDGGTAGSITDMMVRDWTEAEADAALLSRRSRLLTIPHSLGPVEVFVEVVAPPVNLILFGAGPDAVPVVRLAKEIGWHVTVADARPSYAQSRRFPEADRVVLTQSDRPLGDIDIETDSVAVVMNHNFAADRNVLTGLLAFNLPYIGVLGPLARTERILSDLNIRQFPNRLHAPVGLDIGGDTPELIALSILAEIQTALSGRSARMLRTVALESRTSVEPSDRIPLCA